MFQPVNTLSPGPAPVHAPHGGSSASRRTIAHLDLDSFYVSVERRKNPALLGKPVAVGGSSERGVIASCSYEARRYGVHSAMSSRLAKKICPELLIVKGDMESYSSVSREITEIIAATVPLFEKSSIDEFYIDLSGMDRFFGSAKYLSELREKIIKSTHLPVSYGLASNKLVSKMATNEAKPNGKLEISPGFESAFLNPLRIEKIPMVGRHTTTVLRCIGIDTIGDLSRTPLEILTRLLGKNGLELWRKAQGIDENPVLPWHRQKSTGTENTFRADTSDIEFLHRQLVRMTEQLAFDLRDKERLAGCITIKLRYSDFETVTKQAVVPYTASDHVIFQKARELFDSLFDHRLPVRLLGLRLSHLVQGKCQINIFDDTEKSVSLYRAIDQIKQRFGEQTLIRAAGNLFSGREEQSRYSEDI